MAVPGEGEGRPRLRCKEEVLPCIASGNQNLPSPPALGLIETAPEPWSQLRNQTWD